MTRKTLTLIGTAVLLITVAIAASIWIFIPHGQNAVYQPGTFQVYGSLVLIDDTAAWTSGTECAGQNGYDDIAAGTQVVITDRSGDTVAFDELRPGSAENYSGLACVFEFEVPRVPRELDTYGVEISHRGRLMFKEADLHAGLELSLGD